MFKKLLLAGLVLALAGAYDLRADKLPIATESHKLNPAVPHPEPQLPPKYQNGSEARKPATVSMQNLLTGEVKTDVVYDLDTYLLPELSGFWLITVEQDGQLLLAEALYF